MLNVQLAMRDRRLCDAIGIYRAARELWPDGSFGKDGMSVDEEMSEIREIFVTDLSDIKIIYQAEYEKVYGKEEKPTDDVGPSVSDNEGEKNEEEGEEEVYDEWEEGELDDERETNYQITETPFIFDEYLSYFAKPEIISW